jgi:hypothetical protein
MALTDAKRQKAHDMFSKGKTSQDVAKSLKISVASAAAMKANWTRNTEPSVYEITGTFWVEAPNRESAIQSFRPKTVNGNRVLDVETESIHKLSANQVDELFV